MAKALTVHPKLAKWRDTVDKRLSLASTIVKPSFKMECINTGSTVLNLLIGGSRLTDGSFVCPGYPKGSIVEIFGAESSGKTTLALMAMGQAIGSGGCGVYVDLEHAVKDYYAMRLGCDFRPPELGGSGNAMRVAPHTFEETAAIVDAAALQGVDLIVIDSVAGMVSRREISRDVSNEDEKAGIAEIPRLMSNWLPKLQAIIAKTKTTVIFLNQTRDKIGAFGFSEESKKSTVGGNALKFWASLRWFLKPHQVTKARVFNPLTKSNEDVPIATDVLVKNIKNKIDARQGHVGLVTIRYGTGVDEIRTMINVAEAYKLLVKTKNATKQQVFTYKNESKGYELTSVGLEKFRADLLAPSNKGVYDDLMANCVEKIMTGLKVVSDEDLATLETDAVKIGFGDDSDDMLVAENNAGPEVTYEEDGPVINTPDISTDD